MLLCEDDVWRDMDEVELPQGFDLSKCEDAVVMPTESGEGVQVKYLNGIQGVRTFYARIGGKFFVPFKCDEETAKRCNYFDIGDGIFATTRCDGKGRCHDHHMVDGIAYIDFVPDCTILPEDERCMCGDSREQFAATREKTKAAWKEVHDKGLKTYKMNITTIDGDTEKTTEHTCIVPTPNDPDRKATNDPVLDMKDFVPCFVRCDGKGGCHDVEVGEDGKLFVSFVPDCTNVPEAERCLLTGNVGIDKVKAVRKRAEELRQLQQRFGDPKFMGVGTGYDLATGKAYRRGVDGKMVEDPRAAWEYGQWADDGGAHVDDQTQKEDDNGNS